MRFKIGDKVEVVNNKEVPVSWCTAEVLSVTGHAYLVQYDSYPGMSSNRITEMVSRKFVRPCPPLVQGVESFIAGDTVEVFYQYSWKIGAILDIMGGKKEIQRNRIHWQAAAFQKQYLVRLLGCSQDLVVDSSNIRMRQTWHDGKWILMGKSSRSGDDVISSKPSTSNCFQKINSPVPQFNARASNRPKKISTTIQDAAAVWESPVHSPRPLKRMSPYGSSVFEAHDGHVQKLRAVEKEGTKQRMVATPLVEKVDAVAYPKENLGGKNMHASSNIISNGYTEREKQHVLGYSGVRSSELNSSDSDACSVGSCSVTDQSPKTWYNTRSIPMHCQGIDTLCSDAESSSVSGFEGKSLSLPPKEELEVSIRWLELHAYRSTLEALYASGPLSWEQEAMLTNLRIMLHISNDEHLKELKQLISAKTTISVR